MADWTFLKRGDQLEFDKKRWRIEHVSLSGGPQTEVSRVVLLDTVQGRACNLTGEELDQAYDTGRLVMKFPSSHVEDVRPFEEAKLSLDVRVRLYYTRAYDEERPAKSTAALQSFIDRVFHQVGFPHRKPSPGSVRRWVNERGAPGQRMPNTMRRRHATGPRGMLAEPELAEIISDNFDRYFWSR